MSILPENIRERLTALVPIVSDNFTPVFKFHGSEFGAGCGAIKFADLATGLISQVKPIEHPCAMRLIGPLWNPPSRTSSTQSFTPMPSGPTGELQPYDIAASAISGVAWPAACMSGSNPTSEI
ncbi:hypothetical protein [Sphingobium ummariense]